LEAGAAAAGVVVQLTGHVVVKQGNEHVVVAGVVAGVVVCFEVSGTVKRSGLPYRSVTSMGM